MTFNDVRGVALLLGLAVLGACGKTETPAASASGGGGVSAGAAVSAAPAANAAPGAPAAAPAGRAKPGYAIGRLTEEGSKIIDVPGAKLMVAIYGVSSKSGEKVSYSPKVNPDGTYEQKVVDGTYHFSFARIDVPFNGKHFWFDLEPVGDDREDRESERGIVQDYVWKLHGLKPGQDVDESNFTKWYGGSVNMQFQGHRNDLKKSVAKPPAGTRCIFTLTPEGKLIDGSQGKSLTFEREYDSLLTGLKNRNLPDVPIGVYVVKGEEIAPDGTKRPLLMQQDFAKFGESTKVEFAPGSTTGAWPANIGFTRDEK